MFISLMLLLAANDANYFPVKPGTKWTYKATVGGDDLTFKATLSIGKTEKGQTDLEVKVNGNDYLTDRVSFTDKGVFRHSFNAMSVDPPVCILQLPVKKNDKWTKVTKNQDGKLEFSCKVIDDVEEIEVPAGKYKAVHVSVSMNNVITEEYWLVADVGMVKQVLILSGQKITMVLESAE